MEHGAAHPYGRQLKVFRSAARSAALGRSGIQEIFSKSGVVEGKAVLSLHSAPHSKG